MGSEQANKNKNLVMNLIVVVIAGVVAFNLYQKNEQAKIKLSNNIKEEQKKSEVLEGIDRSEKTMAAFRKLLSKKDTNLVMASITNMAKEFGIRVVTVKPVPEIRFQEFIRTPFVLTVAPLSYHALGKFISAIESAEDVYVVDSVEITTGQEGEPGKLMANVTITSIALAE